ncbi:MAG TPA: GntR family transcriptional regulator [Glaciibacter sp.]|nr:GntR family transcriptional regulator [Glaciibacter sp.]
MVAVDIHSASPPSEQIYQQLLGLILSGRVAPGERLPTVRQLARDLGVAAGTVARAYKQLEAESFVVTRSRAGTTVSHSARSLPPDVLIAARDLYEAASRNGLTIDQVVATLTGIWAVTEPKPPRGPAELD